MTAVRRQFSLYVPDDVAGDIEAVRKLVDPVQHGLIPAHITLCREDELGDLPAVRDRLSRLTWSPLTLRFGRPETFLGHGLLLPCIDGAAAFHRLREQVLASTGIRAQQPHITLAHPRNPKAAGNSMANTATLPAVIEITFPVIYLIEQEGLEPWKILTRYLPPA